MSWLILVLVSAFSLSVATLFQRLLLKEEQSDPAAYAAFFQLLVAVLVFGYAIFSGGFVLPPLKSLIFNLVLLAVLYAFADLALFGAFKTVEASEVAVIGASRMVWAVIPAIIFLKETLDLNRLAGILLVSAGIIALSLRKGKWNLNKGHLLVLFSSILLGFAFTNDMFLVSHFEAVSFTAFVFPLPAITILLFRPKSIPKLKLFLDARRLSRILIAALFFGIASVTMYLAHKVGGEVSQIGPLSQLSVVLTVILAYFFLKEKDYLGNKIIGAILVFIGAAFLV